MGRMVEMIVIFCGVPACGKSTVARKLAKILEDLDVNCKLLVSDNLSGKVYEKVFRFLEDNIEETEYLMVDATFYRKKWRDRVREISEESDEGLLIVYLHCSLETSLRRNEQKKEEDQVMEKAVRVINNVLERPKNPDLGFDTDRIDPGKVVGEILEKTTGL